MQNDDQPIKIKLTGFGSNTLTPARRWVSKQYSTYKLNPLNSKQLVFDYGNAITLVELEPDLADTDTVWINWIQSTPQQTGAATKTIEKLQQDAAESDISLKLDIFQTGAIDPARLEQIYSALGFVKDGNSMIWHPSLIEAWSNKYKKSINCSNPKGFSQKAHCAARRKRQSGGKTSSKPVVEHTLSETVTAYHGSPKRNIRSRRFWPLTHFGTEKAAQDRMKMYAKHKKVFGKDPNFDYRIYQVELDIKNPAMIKDEDVSHDPIQFAFALNKAKIFSKLEMMSVTVWPTIKSTSHEDYEAANQEARKYSREKQRQVSTRQLIKLLKSKGYDSMVYKNKHEDRGSLSYVILDPSQARIVRAKKLDELDNIEDDTTLVEAGYYDRNIERQIELVRKDPWKLLNIDFPNVSVVVAAAIEDADVIKELDHIDEETQLALLKVIDISDIPNPTIRTQLTAIEEDPYCIGEIENLSTAAMLHALQLTPFVITTLDYMKLARVLHNVDVKEIIIKFLLKNLKYGDDVDTDDVKELVNFLISKDVEWPELVTIEKSINSTLKETLKETRLPELTPVLGTFDKHTANTIKTEAEKMLRDMFEYGFTSRPILNFLNDIGWRLDLTTDEIKIVVESLKSLMLEYIEHIIGHYSRPFSDLSAVDPLYWILRSIAVLKHQVKVDWAEIDQILETYKNSIIKACLYQVRLANPYSFEDLENILIQLENIDVKWPELALIRRSVPRSIDESTHIPIPTVPNQSPFDRLTTKLLDRMRKGYFHAVMNIVDDLKTYDLDDQTTLNAMFENVKPNLIDYIRYCVETSIKSDPFYAPTEQLTTTFITMLTVKKADIKWPEIDAILNENKTAIIRNILTRLKLASSLSDGYTVSTAIDLLQELGYSWPELDIIQTSLKQSRYRLRENTSSSNNSSLTPYQEIAIANLRHPLSRGRLVNGSMAAFLIHFNSLRLNDAQKASVMLELDQDFEKFVTRRIKSKDTNTALDVFVGLVSNNLNCPRVTAVIEKHKPAILKGLLSGLKNNYNQASRAVEHIAKHNILNWPELEIIMKSINSSKLNETELLAKPTPTVEELAVKHKCTPQDVLIELRKGVAVEQEHTDRLEIAREIALDHLNEDLYYYEKLAKIERTDESADKIDIDKLLKSGVMPALNTLSALRKNVKSSNRNLSDVEEALEKIKPHVIKYVLHRLKNENIYDASRILFLAKDAGANWKELDIMQKSIALIKRKMIG